MIFWRQNICNWQDFMNDRQKSLIKFIVLEHIQTALPIGSKLINDKYISDVSGATIRNEMQYLEQEGFLTHPHTSAGRVPTEAGYRFYLDNFLNKKDISQKQKDFLAKIFSEPASFEEKLKLAAKKTAELTNEAVLIGFAPNNVYYTGLSNLFQKPEFAEHSLVVAITRVIDHLDDVMVDIHKKVESDVSVLLGSDNPFGQDCGAVLGTYKIKSGYGVIGLLGPMRMNYEENIAYLKFIKNLIEK